MRRESKRLLRIAAAIQKHLPAELLQIPEVVTVFFLAGTRDILIHVAARDVDHLRHVCERFTSRPEVAHIETSLILEYAHSHSLPEFAER